jgi:hypothetical protein
LFIGQLYNLFMQNLRPSIILTLRKVPLWLWVVAAFFLLNVLTLDWYPSVWMDEVLFVDPAANLYHGHGFTSTAWPLQRLGEFWAGNTPLYPLLVYAWFKAFGFGLVQVRIFDCLLWSGAVGLVCLAVQRSRLIRNPRMVAMLAALLFIGNGVVFSYRSGRYDAAMVFAAAACFWAFTIERREFRIPAIVLAASFFLPISLVLGPFAAALGCILFLLLGKKYFWELASVAAGLAVGLGLLYLFYGELGVWHKFRNSASYFVDIYYSTGQTIPLWKQKLVTFPQRIFHDSATTILLLCLLGLTFFKWDRLDATGRRLAIFGIGTFLVIPAVSQAAYTYQIYHSWEAYIPMAVCFAGALDHSRDIFKASVRRVLGVSLILVIFTCGLGARLGIALTDLKGHDYSRVESLVQTAVRPSDVVFADYQAFYPLHKLNVTAYYLLYFSVINRQEADSINCLIIDPASLAGVEEKIGGEWRATGESCLSGDKFNIALLDRLLPSYFNKQTNRKYNLMVYRRVPARAPAAN